MTDRHEMEAVVEAILFVSNDVVPRIKLLEVFDEKEREAAAEALEAVIERYREDAARGVMIDEAAGGLRLVSRPDLHSYLRRFFELTGSNKLSMPGLESLAIIAYRQPVTAPEIQELRGVNSSGVLKKLLERRLIRISGRKEVVGKPFLYATTREFLQHFGLRNLKELPPLEQFEELFGGDAEAAPSSIEPDPEEQADREVAEIEAQDDEAFDKAEAEAIEEERAVAEEAGDMADEPVVGAEAVADEPGAAVEAPVTASAAPDADIDNPGIDGPDPESVAAEDTHVEGVDDEELEVEDPVDEKSDVEVPGDEQPDVEEPNVDEPDVDEPDVDEPDVDEPDVDEPDDEEPDVDDLDVDEPQASPTEVKPADSSAEETAGEQPDKDEE